MKIVTIRHSKPIHCFSDSRVGSSNAICERRLFGLDRREIARLTFWLPSPRRSLWEGNLRFQSRYSGFCYDQPGIGARESLAQTEIDVDLPEGFGVASISKND